MIALHGFLVCPTAEEADRISLLLPEHVRLTRAEPGCLMFEVWRSREDPTRFAVAEHFRDREAFERHRQRAAQSDWGKATQGLVRDYRITES
jgi:quinol monooxygenase YgiN